jgi:hypothetical protein
VSSFIDKAHELGRDVVTEFCSIMQKVEAVICGTILKSVLTRIFKLRWRKSVSESYENTRLPHVRISQGKYRLLGTKWNFARSPAPSCVKKINTLEPYRTP